MSFSGTATFWSPRASSTQRVMARYAVKAHVQAVGLPLPVALLERPQHVRPQVPREAVVLGGQLAMDAARRRAARPRLGRLGGQVSRSPETTALTLAASFMSAGSMPWGIAGGRTAAGRWRPGPGAW